MFVVQVNFPILLEHLQDTGDAWDMASAEDWLRQQGFVEQDDGWLGDERAVASLDQSEVISQRRR